MGVLASLLAWHGMAFSSRSTHTRSLSMVTSSFGQSFHVYPSQTPALISEKVLDSKGKKAAQKLCFDRPASPFFFPHCQLACLDKLVQRRFHCPRASRYQAIHVTDNNDCNHYISIFFNRFFLLDTGTLSFGRQYDISPVPVHEI